MKDYFITDYDITVSFHGRESINYTIPADSPELAEIFAKGFAYSQITITSIKDMNGNEYKNQYNHQKYYRYYLNQIDANGNKWSILKDNDFYYLKNIAEKMSLPKSYTIEVIGTNDVEDNYKSYGVLFTKEF